MTNFSCVLFYDCQQIWPYSIRFLNDKLESTCNYSWPTWGTFLAFSWTVENYETSSQGSRRPNPSFQPYIL